MKKTFIVLSLVTAFLISAATLSGAAFYIYAKKIDASLDFDALMSSRGLTSVIYKLDENGNEIESVRLHGSENRIWADLDVIPRHVVDAFVSIEDHRFFEHSGVDLKRTIGAALNFFGEDKKSYGGSTITQQLIKNLTGDDSVSVKRKINEIVRSLKLEKTVSKNEILEAYLNTVYLSNGCYGVETASEYLFSKKASELTLAEAASLAAILKYPYKYDPVRRPDDNVSRRNVVLARMFELGKISESEYSVAVSEPLTLNIDKTKSNYKTLSWFEETVIDDVARDISEKFGYDKKTAYDMIYGGGLKILTTENAKIQTALEKIYANESNFPTSGVLTAPQSTAAIVDSHTGALLAIVGARGKKTANRTLNYATRLTRSPGSVIKPLSVYAPALDEGLITWASVFDDVPVTFEQTDDGYTTWPLNNPRVYSGLVNVNHALKTSINTVSVKILRRLGAKNSFDFLRRLGITTLVENRRTSDGKTVSDISDAPMALGAVTDGCTLYQLCGAYTVLSNSGEYRKIHSYTKVYDRNGNILLQNANDGEQIISEESADIMTRMLCNVVTSGTAKGMSVSKSVAVAGKTGTSGADRDRWFIGYSPDFICGVWYGYVDNREIGNYAKNPACTMFDKVMSEVYSIYPELRSNKFKTSDNVVPCLYCLDSGKRPCDVCSLDPRGNRTEIGYFIRGTEPESECDVHIAVDYDAEHGGVVCGLHSANENTKKVALVKNYSRSFPCPVTITDAEYTYRFLSPLDAPSENDSEAYFQSLQKDSEYFGTSGKAQAFNRAAKPSELDPFDNDNADEPEFEDIFARIFGWKR